MKPVASPGSPKSCVLCGGRGGVRSFHRTETIRLHGSDLRASFPLCPGCFDSVRTMTERSGGLYRLAEEPLPAGTTGAEVVSGMWPRTGAVVEPPPEVPESFRTAVQQAVADLRSRLQRNPDAEEIALHLFREGPLGGWLWKTVYAVACETGWRPPSPEERARERLRESEDETGRRSEKPREVLRSRR